MNRDEMLGLAEKFLAAWNTHDPERTLACYTEDVEYRDPNTRGAVLGHEALRRYLTKLFAAWRMHWSLREAHLFEGGRGCAVLWRATLQRREGGPQVEVEGMDHVEVENDRIARNEVWFDRVQLGAALAGPAPDAASRREAS